MFFHKAENIVGKGENAGYTSIFFFSHNVFKWHLSQGRQKSGLYGKGLSLNVKQNILCSFYEVQIFVSDC